MGQQTQLRRKIMARTKRDLTRNNYAVYMTQLTSPRVVNSEIVNKTASRRRVKKVLKFNA